MTGMLPGVSRRDFLKTGAAAGGLVLAADLAAPRRLAGLEPEAAALSPSVFVQIESDESVTIWVTKSEMGQGVRTALPMILADELEADWSRIRIRQADGDPRFGSTGTGGSTSVSTMWQPLRKAGAQAREMLIAAAAARWGVAVSQCRAESGAVRNTGSGARLSYGQLAEQAATLPVPDAPRLKTAAEFRLIGKSMARTDVPDKVRGAAQFGLDVRVPGMRFAVIARCPVLGGKMQGYDAEQAKAVPGVIAVVPVSSGVGVVAESTFAALQGRKALQCRWDDPETTRTDSAGISRMLHARVAQVGELARNDGDAPEVIARSARKAEATFEVPFLAHAPMEPMNCVADVKPDRCEVWAPTQAPTSARFQVARALEFKPDQVVVHTTLLGGGFGRRFYNDFIREAVEVSRAVQAPVQLLWTREDDMQHGQYRPASVHRLSGAVTPDGKPLAWFHRMASPSISEFLSPGSVTNGLDLDALDGAVDLRYGIPNLRVEYCMLKTPVPVLWWRSVYASQTCFANECFTDELAELAGQDPVAFRRLLLADSPRHLAVLDLAAEKAGWGNAPAGRAQGIAIHHFFSDAIVAEVAEVSLEGGKPRVHKVTAAVDCGLVVNPDGVAAQIESAVIYGLSAALRGAITLEEGRVQQSNFHDYPVVRIDEAPVVSTHVVPSSADPCGVGEPGLPPLAPAVANALYRLTGKRVRKLPLEV